ncbi:MAG: hypothetical protein ACRDRK_12930 [Pseudonocardia sp.]
MVLDAGALIALERRDTRMLALADLLHRHRRSASCRPAWWRRFGADRLDSTR